MFKTKEKDLKDLATSFMLDAIQEWGQEEKDRIRAVQDILDVIGFKAKAGGFPVFGGIWTKSCTGKDADKATEWLKKLTDEMPRGKIETEVEYIMASILSAIEDRGGK